ncbi:MAG: hypothetical protein ABFR65_13875, partial [Pseudomonadota bacterium]
WRLYPGATSPSAILAESMMQSFAVQFCCYYTVGSEGELGTLNGLFYETTKYREAAELSISGVTHLGD